MSSLSSLQTKSRYYRTSYFTNTAGGRAEFMVEPKRMLSNWRLANLGIDTYTNGGGLANVAYTYNCGAAGIIRNMYLNVNDSEQIDVLREVSDYLAHKLTTNDNEDCYGLTSPLNKTRWGFLMAKSNTIAGEAHVLSNGRVVSNVPALVSAGVEQGILDLRLVFKFLSAFPVVYGDRLKNMKLIIEWSTDSTAASFLSNTAGAFGAWTAKRPILIVDELVGQSSLEMTTEKMPDSIKWFTLERDVVPVAATALNIETLTSRRIRAFDGRVVNRLLLVNSPPGHLTNAFLKKNVSTPQRFEKINFQVNGTRLFSYNGIEEENRKLARMSDTWGNQTLFLGANLYATVNSDQYLNNVATGLNNMSISLSYGGLSLNETRINELILEYRRTGGTNARQQDAMNMIVIAEVGKELVLKKEGFGESKYL